jgi:chromosome segregation ATPase
LQQTLADEAQHREELAAELASLREVRKAVEAHLLELDARLSDEAHQRSDVEHQLADTVAVQAALTADLDASRRRVVSAEAERDAALEARAVVDETLAAARAEVQSLREGAASSQQDRAALESELAALRGDHDALVRERDAARGELEIARAKWLAAESAAGATEDAAPGVDVTAAERDALRQAVRDTERDLEALRHELDAARRTNERLEARLAAAGSGLTREEAEDLNRRAEAADRRSALAHQNLDEYRARFHTIATEREQAIAKSKILAGQLQQMRARLEQVRTEARQREDMLTQYIRQLHDHESMETSLVELTDDEIRRAQASGATIVEMEGL